MSLAVGVTHGSQIPQQKCPPTPKGPNPPPTPSSQIEFHPLRVGQSWARFVTVGFTHGWSFYICRALYLRIPLPSPPWGRGGIASGAFISRCETGEGVLSERLI